jgi:hypothetical protein
MVLPFRSLNQDEAAAIKHIRSPNPLDPDDRVGVAASIMTTA